MDATGLRLFSAEDCPPAVGRVEGAEVRGVGWVLRWAATIAVLSIGAATLTSFGCQVIAERALAAAASAGLREAACEHATSRSVETVVRARLSGCFALDRAAVVLLTRNGSAVKGVIRPRAGERLSVEVTAPASAALPRLVAAILAWRSEAQIRAAANSEPRC